METKMNTKKWIELFLLSIILGIIVYALSIKIIFKPDFSELYNVALLILKSLGHPNLKMKAYICVLFLFAPFIMGIIYWLLHKNTNFEQYGNAEFAKLESEEDYEKMLLSKDKGLMLGCFLNQNGEIKNFIRATKPFATLIVAPPGTGKTSSVALPNLYSLENSCVVLDIKGELYEKSAGYRQQNLKNKILLFSPFSEENTLFFNPFNHSVIKDMNFIQMMKLDFKKHYIFTSINIFNSL